MAYDRPFLALSRDGVTRLRTAHDLIPIATYIDCLAMLHDVVGEYGTAADHGLLPYLDYRLTEDAVKDHIQTLWSHPIPLGDIIENIYVNAETAFELQHEFLAPVRGLAQSTLRGLADDYVDRLLVQYRDLRL